MCRPQGRRGEPMRDTQTHDSCLLLPPPERSAADTVGVGQPCAVATPTPVPPPTGQDVTALEAELVATQAELAAWQAHAEHVQLQVARQEHRYERIVTAYEHNRAGCAASGHRPVMRVAAPREASWPSPPGRGSAAPGFVRSRSWKRLAAIPAAAARGFRACLRRIAGTPATSRARAVDQQRMPVRRQLLPQQDR